MYTIREGRAKGTLIKLHYTQYDNHTNIPSWGGGYGNIFRTRKTSSSWSSRHSPSSDVFPGLAAGAVKEFNDEKIMLMLAAAAP